MRVPSAEFIRAIPKTDLHVHLDGSLRPATLIELARERGVELPSTTEDGLRETVFKERYSDLGNYLRGFAFTCGVMQDVEAIERVAYELGIDSFSEGCRYIEPRLAPQLHINDNVMMADVMQAVERGLKRATDEFNADLQGDEPPYAFGIIVCAMRMFGAYSQYYGDLLRLQAYAPPRATFGLASLELARAAVTLRDELGLSIVGFDIAGQEDGYPPRDHAAAFRHAHSHFLRKTVHAGEAYGAESIFESITWLHTDRIGHGFYLFDADRVQSPSVEDRERYVTDLAEYIADRRITIEVCLTSNEQTVADLTSLADHPLKRMLEAKISTTLCTDNRLVSWTTACNEIARAVGEVGLTPKQLKDSVINGFKRSFMPSSYLEKRDYVRSVIDYYEKIEDEFDCHGKR